MLMGSIVVAGRYTSRWCRNSWRKATRGAQFTLDLGMPTPRHQMTVRVASLHSRETGDARVDSSIVDRIAAGVERARTTARSQ